MSERIQKFHWEAQHTSRQQLVDWDYLDKFAALVAKDIAGMYSAIDNGNSVEGTDDFIEAVMRRYAGTTKTV